MFLSVAMCTFNGSVFITDQLDSIIEQKLKIDEIIICDDGSNDDTLEILNSYKLRHPNLIKLYTNQNSLGTIKNFEKAISKCTGDLIFLSDQDDVWSKKKVEKMVYFFNKNKKCKLLFSNGNLIDSNGNNLNSTLWDKWEFNNELKTLWKNNTIAFKYLIKNNNKITGATICFHNSLKKDILPINLPQGFWHDTWLGIHASARNGLYFINESLINYRIHKKQQVGISNLISPEVTKKSNPNFIKKKKFYSILRKKYPNKNDLIPAIRSEYLIKKIIKKIVQTNV